jgi:hypothetical protein
MACPRGQGLLVEPQGLAAKANLRLYQVDAADPLGDWARPAARVHLEEEELIRLGTGNSTVPAFVCDAARGDRRRRQARRAKMAAGDSSMIF